MTKQNTITWVLLMILTILAGWVSGLSTPYLVPIILVLAILKFLGVTYHFMEMNKAHTVWKILILGYVFVFCTLILALL